MKNKETKQYQPKSHFSEATTVYMDVCSLYTHMQKFFMAFIILVQCHIQWLGRVALRWIILPFPCGWTFSFGVILQ